MGTKELSKNKDALKKRYTKIYDEILKYESKAQQEYDTRKIVLLDTRDGEEYKALKIIQGEKKFLFNSTYHPIKEAKKWADQFEYNNLSTHIIIFGLGNGIFVRELINRIGKDNILFIIEPNYYIFAEMMKQTDLSDIILDERVVLFFLHRDKKEIRKQLAVCISWANTNMIIHTIHPGYSKFFVEETQEFQNEVDKIIEKTIVNQNTMEEFSEISIYNVIRNLKYIKKSNYINELIGKLPENYPVVIVSAGPSLQKNVEQLRLLHDRALILVVDTAVKVLEENNVPYDAIVLIDPLKPAEFITNYSRCKEKPLFCQTESQNEILKFHTGRKIWLPDCVWLEGVYKRHGLMFAECNNGGSVATVATEVARILNAKTIILVGQDLAYLGSKTHAGREHTLGEERGYPSEWVEGIDGDKVRTRWDWIYYLHWFEDFIVEHPDITLIDATEGGALIHGSSVMSLEDAIKKFAGECFVFERCLEELPYTFEKNNYNLIERDIYNFKNGMTTLEQYCKIGLSYLKLFQDSDMVHTLEEYDQALFNCMTLNQKIAKIEGYELIEISITKFLKGELEDVNKISNDARKDKENTAIMLEKYYNAVLQVSRKISSVFEESFEEY